MGRLYYPQARAILQVIFDGFGENDGDTAPVIIPILPKRLTIQRNSYRQADSWELELEANDLPIDPNLIRSGAAELFLFQTNGLDEGQRILDRRLSELDGINDIASGERSPSDTTQLELGMAAVQDKFTLGNRPQVAGLFDRSSLSMSSGGKWVTINGQDYTTLFTGKQWPPRPNGRTRRIPTGQRLDRLMERLIREVDSTGRVQLAVEGIRAEALPIVGRREIACHKRGIPVDQNTNYWDVLYKLAIRHGFIVFVRGLDVVLTRPKTLRETNTSAVKCLEWGKNIEDIELTRSLGKEKVPRIIVKAYDEKTRKIVSVTFPKNEQPTPQGTLGVEADEFKIFTLHGVRDREALQRAAENIFELLGRSERTVRVTTKDLKDGRENTFLNMTSGDAVEIEFRDFNSETLSNPDVSEGEKIAHLEARGFGSAIAQIIAEQYVKLTEQKRPMRAREITYEYDTESGISIEAELVDFAVVDGQRVAGNIKPRSRKRAERIVKRDGTPITGRQDDPDKKAA
jgi:hypothetical protein